MQIQIDNEFKSLIPLLTAEEYAGLEKSILEEGCRDALVLWNGIIIDGHNRYEICTQNNIPFNTTDKQFESREKAKEWIILNQFSRRNLSAYDRSLLALKLKDIISKQAEQRMKSGIPVPKSEQGRTLEKLAKIADVGKDTIYKIEKIEQKATPEQKEKIKKGEVSIHKVFMDINREEKREAIKQDLKTVELPKGTFNVILADPPWKYKFSETESRAIENQYPTMELEDIKNLKIPSADNSVLFLWATAPKLEEALQVLNAWGFEYRTCAVWDKEVIGMGYWFRVQHELLLVGVKGNFAPPTPDNRISSVIREKRDKHSKKPEQIYDLIEKMFPNGKFLELFARENKRTNWTVWGNQCE
ncbi:MAG: hypothetical protein A4E55_00231 [Pelotomaculum sp. PtaU1.Bin035]|nr:MAG: hypothetical protein A4E55_00231 [Pelotomaculum sp. PtaU1.Bin035]